MWDYTDKVKEHFLNPRNVGEIENPDGVAEVGSLACGDALKLTFKLDENKRIRDAKFKTFGCASAIASSSALTEMIKGMTVDEALKVTNQDIARYLGGLPDEKMHCSVMGKQALEKAIENYRGAPSLEPGAKIICECFGVTDKEIERAIRENNLATVEDVTNYTKAGGGCGDCQEKLAAILAEELASLSGLTVITNSLAAALKLGAARVIGIDIDPQAIQASHDNAERNGVAGQIELYLPADQPQDVEADVVVANILAGPLRELAPLIAGHGKPGSLMALSGVLESQAPELETIYGQWFDMDPTAVKEEWCRLSGRKHG